MNSDGMIIGLAAGGTANLNLDGMYGQDDSRPTSGGIAANRKCGEDNAAGNSGFGKLPDGLVTLAMDRGATEPEHSLTWRGSDLFSSEGNSS